MSFNFPRASNGMGHKKEQYKKKKLQHTDELIQKKSDSNIYTRYVRCMRALANDDGIAYCLSCNIHSGDNPKNEGEKYAK